MYLSFLNEKKNAVGKSTLTGKHVVEMLSIEKKMLKVFAENVTR